MLATGVGYTIRDFLEVSFGHVGLDWAEFVKFDERYLRSDRGRRLIGDPTKAADKLGWVPSVHGDELAKHMVDADVTLLERGSEWIDTVSASHLSNRDMLGARARERCRRRSAVHPGELDRDATFYVAGHRGLVGSAIVRKLEASGFENVVGKPSAELDLKDRDAVFAYMGETKPKYVVSGCGKGGRHPGELHLPRGLLERQHAHPGQRARCRPRQRRGASAVPRSSLHLPEVRRAAHPRGLAC